jgi:hypothetical protein
LAKHIVKDNLVGNQPGSLGIALLVNSRQRMELREGDKLLASRDCVGVGLSTRRTTPCRTIASNVLSISCSVLA